MINWESYVYTKKIFSTKGGVSHNFEEKFQLFFAHKMMQFRLEVKQTSKDRKFETWFQILKKKIVGKIIAKKFDFKILILTLLIKGLFPLNFGKFL